MQIFNRRTNATCHRMSCICYSKPLGKPTNCLVIQLKHWLQHLKRKESHHSFHFVVDVLPLSPHYQTIYWTREKQSRIQCTRRIMPLMVIMVDTQTMIDSTNARTVSTRAASGTPTSHKAANYTCLLLEQRLWRTSRHIREESVIQHTIHWRRKTIQNL